MSMLSVILFISIIGIFWAYLGYPLSLLIISFFKKRKVEYKNNYFPYVSLIITAYNEEKRIRKKIENTLQLTYPKEKLEILIVSDGSTDKTHDIVREYLDKKVHLHITKQRRGKEFAQKEAIQNTSGDIIVFSDTATILDKNGIQEIVSAFADDSIGCVSSEDIMIGQNGASSGEGAYVKYEMWLRKLESEVNSVVGLSGSFFAARREVLQDFSGEMQSDFKTLLNSVRLGLRGVSNPNAKGYYKNIADNKKEFDRKVRTVLRGLTVYFNHIELLNLFEYGLFSYQYFCHKLLRWLVPWLLLGFFVSNLFLLNTNIIFNILFFLQLLFYFFALIGKINKKYSNYIIIKIPLYFVQVNWGILVAWTKYIKGERVVMWQPSER